MLSILITIYNYNLYPLVKDLHKQCLDCTIDFEILTQDDASKSILNVENEKINLLSNCSFISLEKNIGYRENKNLLAQRSKYDTLLIIDGDCKLLTNNYIQNYLNSTTNFDVVYGGRRHNENCPSNNQKLRWKYGKFIEDKLAVDRLKKPYSALLFNNTLIKKECFNSVKFDGNFKKYGHDDTQFSYQLFLKKTKINHIENPVEHNDIDTNLVYVNKTKDSIKNLNNLFIESKIDVNYVKIMKLIYWLRKLKLNGLIATIFNLFEKTIYKNLLGNNPNLVIFNFFRVGYFCNLDKN